jgi:hypothetical protein
MCLPSHCLCRTFCGLWLCLNSKPQNCRGGYSCAAIGRLATTLAPISLSEPSIYLYLSQPSLSVFIHPSFLNIITYTLHSVSYMYEPKRKWKIYLL